MKIIKLCLISDGSNIDKNRLRLYEEDGKYYRVTISIGVLVEVTKDFDIKDKSRIEEIDNSWSYQIRPKALYKSKDKIYYKVKGERIFLTKTEIKLVMEYINNQNVLNKKRRIKQMEYKRVDMSEILSNIYKELDEVYVSISDMLYGEEWNELSFDLMKKYLKNIYYYDSVNDSYKLVLSSPHLDCLKFWKLCSEPFFKKGE